MQPTSDSEGVVIDSWEDVSIEQQLQRLVPPSKCPNIIPLTIGNGSELNISSSSASGERDADTPGPISGKCQRKQESAGIQAALAPLCVPLIDDLGDPFLIEALQNQRKRLTVLKIEIELGKFVDSPLSQLEFTSNMNSYQRLAIHRVAAFFGLQSAVLNSDDDYNNSTGKIVVRKTPKTLKPIPLSQYKTLEQVQKAAEKIAQHVTSIKRRPSKAESLGDGVESPHSSDKSGYGKTVEERKEDYDRTREQIFNSWGGEEEENVGVSYQERPAEVSQLSETKSGGDDGSCGPESSGGGSGVRASGSSGSLRGNSNSGGSVGVSAAILRDREKDRMDPDFCRGADRFGPQFTSSPYYDDGSFCAQSRYQAPTYNSEFPTIMGGPLGQPPMPPMPPPGPPPMGSQGGGGGYSHYPQPPLPPGPMPPQQQPPLPPHPLPPPQGGMPPMNYQMHPHGMEYLQFQPVGPWGPGDRYSLQLQQASNNLGGPPWMMMMQPPGPPSPHANSHGNLMDLQSGPPAPPPNQYFPPPMGPMQWHMGPPPLPQGAPMFYQQSSPPLPPTSNGSSSHPMPSDGSN